MFCILVVRSLVSLSNEIIFNIKCLKLNLWYLVYVLFGVLFFFHLQLITFVHLHFSHLPTSFGIGIIQSNSIMLSQGLRSAGCC